MTGLVLGLTGRTGAHVAPAIDVNNRYVRLTPMRDGVRLAYTVFIGEVPGAAARLRMDRNQDGMVDEAESLEYGEDLAATLARSLTITVDGTLLAMKWTEMHVGMSSRDTTAGSFSVDLIGWMCTSKRVASHRVALVDSYRIPQPGETELQVTPSPGASILESIPPPGAVAGGDAGPGAGANANAGANDKTLRKEGTPERPGDARGAPVLDLYWDGDAAPLAAPGYELVYTIDLEVAPPLPAGLCPDAPSASHAGGPDRSTASASDRLGVVVLAGVAVLALAALLAGWFLRARSRRARTRTDS